MKTRLLILFASIIIAGISSAIFSVDAVIMPLKYQISSETDPDRYVCWNFDQLLVERPNGKFACVSPYTMMKLGWHPYQHYYNIDVYKDNIIYSVFAHNTSESSGMVSGIRHDANSESVIVDLPRTNPGELFIKIPRELLDAKLVRCGEVTEDPSDWYFLVLVDGEEVEYEEIFTTDDHRTLVIPYEKDLKQIEIAAPCLI